MYPAAFSEELCNKINSAKLLVVGAGGIGCELLKNLVLTGFENIDVIDLDTIDVSNLNRQFLFHKQHVGKSKALVARDSVLRFNPKAKITARHGSIICSTYGISYFRQFTVVLNALDNLQARNYVNRMCLAAKVPMIDSGTAGYQGQVEVIYKGLTQCYECLPRPKQKTYPSCTIRNHPSEHIHCTIWAKHLFNQLFGEDNEEEDISPDLNDPELDGKEKDNELNNTTKENKNHDGRGENGNKKHSCLRITDIRFNSREVFHKVFNEDIHCLLTMSDLWKNRRPPTPLNWNNLSDAIEGSSKTDNQLTIKDQIQWTISECRDVFAQSIVALKKKFEELGDGAMLIWDKDDDAAMDFVAATANLRAHIFGIPLKTKFEIKAMAGNIIPAIATSNAVIAGLVTLQALKILKEDIKSCTPVYLRQLPNARGIIVVPEKCLSAPDPKCYVCSMKPEITVVTNIEKMTCKEFENNILKKSLELIEPEVCHDNRIIISSEEGETDHNRNKTLLELSLSSGSCIHVEDFALNFKFRIFIEHLDTLEEGKFEIVGDISKIQEELPEEPQKDEFTETAQNNKDKDSDSDCEMFEESVNFVDCYNSKKRKLETLPSPAKKKRIHVSNEDLITIN